MAPITALLTVLTFAGCTPSNNGVDTPSAQPTSTPVESPTPQAVIRFGNPPSDWATAISTSVATLPGWTFGPGAVDEARNVIYGSFQSASQQGVGAVDVRSGKSRVVATMNSQESGVIWMSYRDDWLVWAQGESQEVFGNWSIQALNTQTGERLRLATSQLPDGTYLTGELVFPVVGHGYVAWNQPTSATSVDLRVYRFSSHDSINLDSGQLSSPVLASRYLVWAKRAAAGSEPSLRFADAEALQLVTIPAGLNRSAAMNYLAGSPDYLLWIANASDASSTSSLAAYNLTSGLLTGYKSDSVHYLQVPTLAGHFLVWNAPSSNDVLDLRTGCAFDLPSPGSAFGQGDTIVVAKIQPGPKGAVTNTTLAILHPSQQTSIAVCTP